MSSCLQTQKAITLRKTGIRSLADSDRAKNPEGVRFAAAVSTPTQCCRGSASAPRSWNLARSSSSESVD